MKKYKKPKLMLYPGNIYSSKKYDGAKPGLWTQSSYPVTKLVLCFIRWFCVVLAAGCACVIWPESYNLEYNHTVYTTAITIGTLTFGLLALMKLKAWMKYLIYMLVFCGFGYWFRLDLKAGVGSIVREIIQSMRQQFDVHVTEWIEQINGSTWSVTVFIAFLATAIAAVSAIRITTGGVSLPIVLTFAMTAGTVLLSGELLPRGPVVVFAISCVVLAAAHRLQQEGNIKQKSSMNLKISACTLVWCLILWGLSSLIVTEDMYIDKSESQEIKKTVQQQLENIGNILEGEQLFDASEDGISEGRLDKAGNQRFNGTQILEVSLNEKPDSTIYLKGYVGGNFVNNRWMAVDEESFLRMTESQDEAMMIWNVQPKAFASVGAADTMKIVSLNGSEACFAPYAVLVDEDMKLYGDGWIEYAPDGRFTYYPDVYNIPESYYLYGDAFVAYLVPEYKYYVYNTYLQIPEVVMQDDAYTKLQEMFVVKNAGLSDTIKHIRTQLHSQASYTLTPGKLPGNENFLSYFVLENRKGYCMHFASAATLLLRMNGYPARYVEGYVCSADDFEAVSAVQYRSIVRDYQAHAWVEVFLDSYGWVPVEMTPGYDNSEQISQILNNNLESDDMDEAKENEADGSSESEDVFEPQTETMQTYPESDNINAGNHVNAGDNANETGNLDDQNTAQLKFGQKIIMPKWLVNILKAALYLCIIAAAIAARMFLKNMHYQKLFCSERTEKALLILYRAMNQWLWLAGAGKLDALTGSERAEAVGKINSVSVDMFIVFESTAWKAAFGEGRISKQECSRGFAAYGFVVKDIKNNLSAPKIWFAKIILCMPDIVVEKGN